MWSCNLGHVLCTFVQVHGGQVFVARQAAVFICLFVVFMMFVSVPTPRHACQEVSGRKGLVGSVGETSN